MCSQHLSKLLHTRGIRPWAPEVAWMLWRGVKSFGHHNWFHGLSLYNPITVHKIIHCITLFSSSEIIQLPGIVKYFHKGVHKSIFGYGSIFAFDPNTSVHHFGHIWTVFQLVALHGMWLHENSAGHPVLWTAWHSDGKETWRASVLVTHIPIPFKMVTLSDGSTTVRQCSN